MTKFHHNVQSRQHGTKASYQNVYLNCIRQSVIERQHLQNTSTNKMSSDLPSFKSTCTCGFLHNKIKETHKQYLREELKIGLLSKLANEGCVVTDVWAEELNGSADPKSATNLLEGQSGVNMFSLEVGAADCKIEKEKTNYLHAYKNFYVHIKCTAIWFT